MKTYTKPWFLADPDEAPGSVADMLVGEDAPDDTPAGDTPDDAPDETPKGGAPAFDVDKLVSGLSSGIIAGLTPALTPKETPKQLSPEEAKKLMKVWEANDDFLTKFGNIESQKDALHMLRDGLIGQADMATQVRLHQMKQELMEQFGPVLQFMQRHETEQRTARMVKAHPELGDENISSIRDAVIQSLVNEGKTFDNESAAFAEVAKRVGIVIKKLNPGYKPATTTKPSGSIPVTTSGGRGGGVRTTPEGGGRTKSKGFALSVLSPGK